MRSSFVSVAAKVALSFFAIAFILGLLPSMAHALNESFGAIEETPSQIIASDKEANSVYAGETVSSVMEFINQEVALDTVVAQAEVSTSYLLANTLESTNTIPVVSAEIPLQENAKGEINLPASSTVLGSFIDRGIAYTVEPGGGTVAVVAVDYDKLPAEILETQVLILPASVSPDGDEYYSVTRIADFAFLGLDQASASSDHKGCEALLSNIALLEEAEIDAFEVQALLKLDDEEIGNDADDVIDAIVEPFKHGIGILVLCIPESVSEVSTDALSGAETLQYIVVSPDNPTFASYDGALYSADLSQLRLIPEGRLGAVCVASNAIKVLREVFSHCPLVDTLVVDADSAVSQLIHDQAGNALAIVDADAFGVYGMNTRNLYGKLALELAKSFETVSSDTVANVVNRSTFGATTDNVFHGPFADETNPVWLNTSWAKWGWHTRPTSAFNHFYTQKSTTVANTAGYVGNASVSSSTYLGHTTFPTSKQIYYGHSANGPWTILPDKTRITVGSALYIYYGDPIVEHTWDAMGGYYASAPTSPTGHKSTITVPVIYKGSNMGAFSFKGWAPDDVARKVIASVQGTNTGAAPGAYWPEVRLTFNGSGNISFKALWERPVTLVLEGGVVENQTDTATLQAKKSDDGNNALATYTLPTPTREDWNFIGWTMSKTTTGAGEVQAGVKNDDKENYYARWSANVAFDCGNDSGTIDAVALYSERSAPFFAQLELPSGDTLDRPGYRFMGWRPSKSQNVSGERIVNGYSNVYQAASAVTIKGHVTFSAVWATLSEISFSPLGPQNETNVVEHRVEASSVVIRDVMPLTNLASLSRDDIIVACEGYDFRGWNTEPDGSGRTMFNEEGVGTGSYEMENSVTLYPIWQPKQRSVKWIGNVPSGASEVGTRTTTETYNTPCEGAQVPTCPGYTFVGWYAHPIEEISFISEGELFRPSKDALAASEIIYYAHWSAEPYSVMLLPGSHGTYELMQSKYVIEDENFGKIYRFAYEAAMGEKRLVAADGLPGWDFNGWERLSYGEDGSLVIVDEDAPWTVSLESFANNTDLIFRAKWVPMEATVTLDPGECPQSEWTSVLAGFPQSFGYDVTSTRTLPDDLNWPGYTFMGWQLVKRGDQYIEETAAPSLDVTVSVAPGKTPTSLTYQAIWAKSIYTLRFAMSEVDSGTQIAESLTGLGLDEEFNMPVPAFRHALPVDEGANIVANSVVSNARIFTHYEIEEGVGRIMPEQSWSIAKLLNRYPQICMTKEEGDAALRNHITIALYGSWVTNYQVDVPLIASISFDPDDFESSLKTGRACLRTNRSSANDALKVVGLVFDPISFESSLKPGTQAVFDKTDQVLEGAYITLSAHKGLDVSSMEGKPVEVNVAQLVRNGGRGIRVTGMVGEGDESISLAELGFAFGGISDADRTLSLRFGLRFDKGIDVSSLKFLNDAAFKDSGCKVPIARVYYTLAMSDTI